MLVSILSGFSQNTKNVTCIYKIYTPFDIKIVKPSSLNDKILKTSPLSYVLKINNNKSLFKLVEKLSVGDVNAQSLRLRKIMSFQGDNVSVDVDKDEIFEIRESLGAKFAVKTKVSDYKWNITSDTKIIDKYTCLKAVCQVPGLGRDAVLIKKEVVAYFCPELNYRFGPREFCGLPGLILEILVDNNVIGLDSITFDDTSSNDDFTKQTSNDYKIFNSYEDLFFHLYGK